ncbi:MAG: 3-keto-5-aminohexanoate cleavage protein [Pseudolabrys sp.]
MGNLLLNLTSPISHCRADSFLGGHVRVGLEDNLYLEKGKLAPSNAALVEKATKIIDMLGDHIATPAEGRKILGLGKT